ncbi:MAG: L-threonylcarbamoyladenylate synthase [Propionibacteriaceae bacterium]
MREQIFDLSSQCDDGLTAAQAALHAGDCAVIPTDTVYGIAADAFNAAAIARLLSAKGRGRDMPVPVLIADISVLSTLAHEVPETAFALAEQYWPGALSLIVKVRPSLIVDLGDTMDTIMVRVPDDDRARALLRRTGPLGVSSANSTGQPPATTCEQAHQMLGDSVSVYLDGGATLGTVPSTIVDFAADQRGIIRRHGVLTTAEIAKYAPEVIVTS